MRAKTESSRTNVNPKAPIANAMSAAFRALWRGRAATATACLPASSASGEPVRIEVVGVRIENGHVVLTLNRRHSQDWAHTFYGVLFTDDFRELTPDRWRHKRKRSISVVGFSLYDGTLRVSDVPGDAASLRQLMLAVRYALDRTNAAEPSEDPPPADTSLNGVLEEVFATGSG